MKLYLASIFSILLLFSSIQESMSQVSSMMFSSKGSCCMTSSTDSQDDSCVIDDTQESGTCCEGTSCDCTCCVHISLFNTSFDHLTFIGESEKEIHSYMGALGYLAPSSIFHPPLV